jgi:hypothetical protein
MNSHYVVNFHSGYSIRYESRSEAIEGISDAANDYNECADSIIEISGEGDELIEYKPKYSVILHWTKILNKEEVV